MAIANPRVSAAVFCVCCGALTACGGDEIKYKPHPPVQGVKATLPPVPNVQKRPVKSGDAYTVWGAGYYLRSRVHHKDIAGTKITLAGYIIKTNISDAPECAVHKGGKADPEDCKPPIPAFWVADTREAPLEESIKVMGWASNYAQIYDAIADFDKGDETAEHMDTFWGIKTPNPLPSKGAKVRVKGTYSTTFSGASTGTEADPIMGLMAYQEIENVEPAPELVTLPGVKRKEPKTEGEPKKK